MADTYIPLPEAGWPLIELGFGLIGMTDRELLEAAAKAADLTIGWDARGAYIVEHGVSGAGDVWNPLTNDGDAFRLLVRLGMFWSPELSHYLGLERFSGQERDDCSAHRRAIVRAAAALCRKDAGALVEKPTEISAAILAERERCAKLCESMSDPNNGGWEDMALEEAAKAIRKGE